MLNLDAHLFHCLRYGSSVTNREAYSEQLIWMAKAFELDYVSLDPTSLDLTVSVLYVPEQGLVALLVVKGIRDITTNVWARLASGQASPKKVEDLYKIREDRYEFLFHHLTASF